ncbi:ABC transporter permease [Microbacterium sp. EST19A]|uniref:ABC transporter permease n=1 Tax=Microbacterium sp. EST19A TaxID=2862681 RepID=UPI001CBD14D6|nr:ABC transporter permease [Microbacterium sp. EST19A]
MSSSLTRFARTSRALLREPNTLVGAGLLLLIIVISVAAPLINTDPNVVEPLNRLQSPSAEHLFGTDNLGRDVFGLTVWGGRAALLITVVSTAIAVLVGYVIGVLAGYYRGFDSVIMRIMDGLMSFPTVVLMISLVGVLGNGVAPLIVGMSIALVPATARLVRGAALSAKELTSVESARAIGARTPRILLRYIAPEGVSVIIVQSTMALATGILVIASLSFIGIGLDPSIPTWGGQLSSAQQYFNPAWWMAVFPGLAIFLTVLGLVLLGDALRDALDPRSSRG